MNVVISGGGTMGHINPALAIIYELKQEFPNARIHYFGCENSLEEQTMKEHHIDFYPIDFQGLNRHSLFKNLKIFKQYWREKKRIAQIYKQIRPVIAIGTGGYVSMIPLLVAKKKQIPYVIHEQNSVPGLANTILARKANAVFMSFQSSKKYFKKANCLLVGNPSGELRDFERTHIKYPYGYKRVLIVGGSLGAANINKAVIDAYYRFKNDKIFVIFVTGKSYYQEFAHLKQDNLLVVPYIVDLKNIMADVDLIVSRAGATTIAEILAIKKPAILIPSTNVTANHQEKNADYLYQNKACIKIEDNLLTGDVLYLEIKEVLRNTQTKMRMIENQSKLYIENSSKKIILQIQKIIRGDIK